MKFKPNISSLYFKRVCVEMNLSRNSNYIFNLNKNTKIQINKRRLGWQTQQKSERWVTTQPTSADLTACYKL